jgi:nucleotide-binding universal stress UspA family protein
MLPIHTILHPTDFSPQSTYAFHLAHALARDYGARLILAHVREPQPFGAYGEFGAMPMEPIETREEMEARLNAMTIPGTTVAVEHCLVDGVAADQIVHLAQNNRCDLIVMGTHGRTGLGRLLMGSVAEKVVRKAPCPVLTVKTPQAEASAILAALDEPALA